MPSTTGNHVNLISRLSENQRSSRGIRLLYAEPRVSATSFALSASFLSICRYERNVDVSKERTDESDAC